MRRRWRPAYVIEMLLLLAGIAGLGTFLWDQGAIQVDQWLARTELDQSIEKQHESLKKPARPKPGSTIGRMEIPRLRIDAIVRSGVDNGTLKRAVGHVPSTALPGSPGNVGLAAHRDTFFRNLKGVKKGDLIRMITPEGAFDYRVESTRIVTPKNIEVLYPTKENALTLVTCYPFNYVGSAPKRFIVRARQVMPSETVAGL